MTARRIAKICPRCESTEYKRTRPEGYIAFTNDRICKACGTRYSPPTPRWAGLVFILIGLIMAATGGYSVMVRLIHGNLTTIPTMMVEALIAGVGLLAIVQGLRAIISPGRV